MNWGISGNCALLCLWSLFQASTAIESYISSKSHFSLLVSVIFAGLLHFVEVLQILYTRLVNFAAVTKRVRS